MGIFGCKNDKKIDGGKAAADISIQLEMSETVAAIAAALELHGSSAGKITIRRSYYSPWRDLKRARAIERL
jgi:hypothetical protein